MCIYFKCNIHNEQYNSYCNQCNKNICILCEKEHKTHDKISLGELIPDINKLNEKSEYKGTVKKKRISVLKKKEVEATVKNIFTQNGSLENTYIYMKLFL